MLKPNNRVNIFQAAEKKEKDKRKKKQKWTVGKNLKGDSCFWEFAHQKNPTVFMSRDRITGTRAYITSGHRHNVPVTVEHRVPLLNDTLNRFTEWKEIACFLKITLPLSRFNPLLESLCHRNNQ